jgi:hypothetical protein
MVHLDSKPAGSQWQPWGSWQQRCLAGWLQQQQQQQQQQQ